MTTEQILRERSGDKCELCGATEQLDVYAVPDSPADNASDNAAQSIYICATCREQIEDPDKTDVNHWRCLNDSMWNPEPAVQVMAWRMLTRLSAEGWPQELLDMLYFDEEQLAWAEAGTHKVDNEHSVAHKDSNGTVLEAGDTVTLVKDLKVKGANFTAKQGTAVRNISLVADNPEHIEGRVEGQRIVILTQFVKKQG